MQQRISRAVIVLMAAIFVLAEAASAQSWPQYTYWTQSPLRLNPAASANLYSLDASVSYRQQWAGLEGAPSTTQAAVGAPIYYVGGGASLGFEFDEIGVHQVSQIRGDLSYQILKRENFVLSLGAGVSYRMTSLNGQDLRTETGSYGLGLIENHRDPSLPASTQSGTAVGVNVGAEAKFGETTVGLSVLDANAPVTDWNTLQREWPRTFIAYGVSMLPIAEAIDLEVSALLQSDAITLQTQAAVTAWYDRNIGVGAAFRGYSASSVDAVSLLVGWRPNASVTIAYAYDYGLSTLQNAHDGSHEIALRYVMTNPIGKGQLPPIIFNPRL